MKCSDVRAFFSQIVAGQEALSPFPSTDLAYLSTNGYVTQTTREDFDRGSAEVARLSEAVEQQKKEHAEAEQAGAALQEDVEKEHSFMFHLEGKEEKEELRVHIEEETASYSKEASEAAAADATVNALIQEKSTIDRMVPFGDGYVSLTGLGTVLLNDLNVRNYRVSDEEFPAFTSEIKATYGELRSIADRASSYAFQVKQLVPDIEEVVDYTGDDAEELAQEAAEATSLMWATAIGLGKLRGDPGEIGQRFAQAVNGLWNLDSTTPNKLMAAEIMTALIGQDVANLESDLKNLENELRNQSVPKEVSAGIASAILAARKYDGTYPTDRFAQFRQVTESYEAAAILAAMNVPFDGLSTKFQGFRSTFVSWGYMKSEDTEIASAFLAIGELGAGEVEDKLKYIIEQLRNYLEYPLVAAAILASIPVFEAHEVLDLMEKAVTLLSAYTPRMERSVQVALAVRMIHGVRNELVKKIDPTATITDTPIQFTYVPRPGVLIWHNPVVLAHWSYHTRFSGMGGFHPAHSHGVGGFAG